jgi:hypothetical protein
MQQDEPRTGPRHEPDRIYERAADPAEAADRPLEPKSSHEELSARDEPGPASRLDVDPHHALNTPIGEPDPDADSDPYRPETDDDDADRASGVRGSGQGSEDG